MDIKKNMLKNETYLCEYASFNKDAIRFEEEKTDIRPEYFRDIDRIIHSMNYSRYINKTQVFTKPHNDHVSTRMIHVQLVSKVARTIGRALLLNEDLIEAAALGHDLGHTPFGHFGESVLNEISLKHNEGYFMHNVQSVRNMMFVENHGKGHNLTIQVLDAFLCHNGELVQNEYRPVKKTKEEFLEQYETCYKDKSVSKDLVPMTLEGCVVRISDIIAYLGRDIEDAIRLKVFDINELPKSIGDILGNSNRDIINTIILDIIENSIGKDYISMSPKVYKAIKDLKEFNYQNIYSKSMTDETREYLKNGFYQLFNYFLEQIKQKNMKSIIYKEFLKDMDESYLNNTTDERKVIDFIAGMTDEYFLYQYKKIQKLAQQS